MPHELIGLELKPQRAWEEGDTVVITKLGSRFGQSATLKEKWHGGWKATVAGGSGSDDSSTEEAVVRSFFPEKGHFPRVKYSDSVPDPPKPGGPVPEPDEVPVPIFKKGDHCTYQNADGRGIETVFVIEVVEALNFDTIPSYFYGVPASSSCFPALLVVC